MRYDLKKFLFVGLASDHESFFKKAQSLGVVQFINSKPGTLFPPSEEIQNIADAIKVLRGIPPVEQEDSDNFAQANAIAKRVNSLNEQRLKLEEEERLVHLEIARVEIFGNFSKEDIEYMRKEAKRYVQFYSGKMGSFKPNENMIYVGTSHGLDYFVGLHKQPKTYEKLVEIHIDQAVGELRKRVRDISHELHGIDIELKDLAKYNTFLHHALIVRLNTQNLQNAEKYAQNQLEGSLFAVEGWVPVNKVDELQKLVDKMYVHVEEVAIEPKDAIPTYLENEGFGKIGEDLVHIYDTPSHTDKDPSLWVLWAFSFFFAFIVNDAGYGLIFLAVALYLHYKFYHKRTGGTRRFIKLIAILGTTTLLWGILINSYFGLTTPIDSAFRKVSIMQWLVEKKVAYHMAHKDKEYETWVKKYPKLKDVTDPHQFVAEASIEKKHEIYYDLYETYARTTLLEMALIIGMMHVSISFLRYIRRNWAGLGWILVIIGGYLYAPVFLNTVSMFYYITNIDVNKGGMVGLQIAAVGTVIALIFLVKRHKLVGILEITMLMQIFADILSYLRLFALGLAGAIVSVTINELSSDLPLVFAVILIVFAHLLNIVLGIMGGVIHGLRLNFLEWYHYSFEGGGRLFQPLRLMKIE